MYLVFVRHKTKMAGSQPSSGQMCSVAVGSTTSTAASTSRTNPNLNSKFCISEEEITNVHKFIENALQLQLQVSILSPLQIL
jgi:hypothetical protein